MTPTSQPRRTRRDPERPHFNALEPPTIVVHGGVRGKPLEEALDLIDAVIAARSASDALDAVERAVVALENHPRLNAGVGAVLARDGRLSLDAGIMDGSSGDAGGVAGVTVRHPVTLARIVLSTTPHVLMIGEGAMELAGDMEVLTGGTTHQQERWQQTVAAGGFDPALFGTDDYVDTVGAVALDAHGRLAAAASTGGLFGKPKGRVGDSCIPGAGFYANGAAAVVATGLGEAFLRSSGCLRTALDIEQGLHPQDACEKNVLHLAETNDSSAAILAIDADGRVGAAFRGGSWPLCGSGNPLQPVRLR